MRKILFTLMILSLCLCLYGCRFFTVLNEMNEDYTSAMEAETANRIEGEKEITNKLGERYRIKYKEQINNIQPNRLELEIISDDILLKYSIEKSKSDYNIPEHVLRLFHDGNTDYYLAMSGDEDILFTYNLNKHYGSMINYHDYEEWKKRNCSDEVLKNICHENIELAEIFRCNITRTDLIEKFRACGYDDSFILKVYDFK